MKFLVLSLLVLGLTLTQSTPVTKKVEKRTALESSKAVTPLKALNLKNDTLKSENSKLLLPKFENLKVEKDEMKDENKGVKKKDELSPEDVSEQEELDREKKSCETMTSAPALPTKVYLEIASAPCPVTICKNDAPSPKFAHVEVLPPQCVQVPSPKFVEVPSPKFVELAQPEYTQPPPSPPPPPKVVTYCCHASIPYTQTSPMQLVQTQPVQIPRIKTYPVHLLPNQIQRAQIPSVNIQPQRLQGSMIHVQPSQQIEHHQILPGIHQNHKQNLKLHLQNLNNLFSGSAGQDQGGLQIIHPALSPIHFQNVQPRSQGGSQDLLRQFSYNQVVPNILRSVHFLSQPMTAPQSTFIARKPVTIVHQQPIKISPTISASAPAMDVSWGSPITVQGVRCARGPEYADAQNEYALQTENNSQSQNSGGDQSPTQMSLPQSLFPKMNLLSDSIKINEENLNLKNFEPQREERQSFMNERIKSIDKI